MTYNIWSGKHWREILDFVRKNQIDIMGLQEVDRNLERTGRIDVTQKIAQGLGYFYVYGASIENQKTGRCAGGQYGNCIISRYPILRSKRYFLSTPGEWQGDSRTEPRTLISAQIKIGQQTLCFMTLHLGFSVEFKTTPIKRKQTRTLIEAIGKNGARPIILTGDFNSLPDGPEIKEVKKYLVDTDQNNQLKTWTLYFAEHCGWRVPAGLKYKIDYIFVSRDIKSTPAKSVKTSISDHLPVISTIDV